MSMSRYGTGSTRIPGCHPHVIIPALEIPDPEAFEELLVTNYLENVPVIDLNPAPVPDPEITGVVVPRAVT